MSKREREGARGGTEGEGEADSPLKKEPDLGLHPRTLRSGLGLRSRADCLTN